MNYRNWISKVVAIAFLSFAVVQVHAFVYMPSSEAVSEDSSALMDRIESIATSIEDGSVTSAEALAMVNQVIDEIDGLLDSEPANEGELLDLRDALVDMRLELSEAEGTQTEVGLGDGSVVSGGVGAPIGGGFSGGGCIGCGSGGGGGAVGGGPNLRRLLLIGGVVGGIVAGTAGGDDDDNVVSMGMAN